MYRIQLINPSVSAGWYCKFYNTIRQRQMRPQPVQKTPVVLILHTNSRQPKYKHKGPQSLRFSPGNLFWDSLTNQNTGNYLHHGINITTNHRLSPTFRGNRNTIIISDSQTSLLPIFSEGGGTSVHRLLCACIMLFGYFLDVHSTVTMQNFLMRHLMGDANTWQQLFLFLFEDKYTFDK